MNIERVRVTAFQQQKIWDSPYPSKQGEPLSPVDKEFFEFEEVNSGLSSDICTYGYRNKDTGKWIKREEALQNICTANNGVNADQKGRA